MGGGGVGLKDQLYAERRRHEAIGEFEGRSPPPPMGSRGKTPGRGSEGQSPPEVEALWRVNPLNFWYSKSKIKPKVYFHVFLYNKQLLHILFNICFLLSWVRPRPTCKAYLEKLLSNEEPNDLPNLSLFGIG